MRKFTKYPSSYVKASSIDTVDQAMKLLDELYAQFEYMLETYGDTPPSHKGVMPFYEVYNQLWYIFAHNHWDTSFMHNLGIDSEESLDATAFEKAYADLKAYVMGNPTDVSEPVNKKPEPLQYIFKLHNNGSGEYEFMCQSAYKPDGTKKYLHNEVAVTFKIVNGDPYILSGCHIGTQDFDFDKGDPWDDYVEYYQPGITEQVLERIKNNDYEYH